MKSQPKEIVLVGAGHAHVIALHRFGRKPILGARLTLISRDFYTPYSGMLPGLVAGHYRYDDAHIDLRPLAQFSGARLLCDRGYGVIQFDQIGIDFSNGLAKALRDVRALGARSVQLSARIGDPGLPDLSDAARDLGFFFCGLGPAFAGGEDLLLLQSLSDPLDTGKLQLFTDQAKELVAFINGERAATVVSRHCRTS